MRYLVLMLLLLGCGPGPKSAKGAPPSKETIVEALDRYDALSVKRDGEMAAKVDGLAETVGNQTAELNGFREETKAELKALRADQKKILDMLSVDTAISIEVPKAPDPQPETVSSSPAPVKADAPPAEAADRRTVTVNGKQIDVAATIKANYRRMWTFPEKEMSIDQHLAEHGVKGAEGLDYDTKRKLHSALHEMGVEPMKAKRVVVKAPIVLPQQSCPNGRCPNVQYGYSTRSRLFGFRR